MTHSLQARQQLSRRTAVTLVAVFTVIALAGAAVAIVALVGDTGSDAAADADAVFAAGPPVPVGAGAVDVEAGGGFVWVSNGEDGTITRVDPAASTTTTIRVGGEPGQIVVGEGALWVRNLGDQITRVDLATGAVSPPIDGGGGQVSGMAVGDGAVWLSHRQGNTVSRLDARTLAVTGSPIAVGPEPAAMEFAPGSVLVLNTGDGSMSRIDTRTGSVTGTVPVGEALGGIEVDRGTVYVAADGGVVPVPLDSFTPGPAYGFEGWSYFEVHDGTMWVVFDEDPGIQRFDAASRQLVGARVPGLGDEVGRARFAFDRLWTTVPGRNQLIAVGPEG